MCYVMFKEKVFEGDFQNGHVSRKKLRNKLLRHVLVVVIVGMLLITVPNLVSGFSNTNHALEASLVPLAENLAERLNQQMNVAKASLTELAYNQAFQDLSPENIVSVYTAVNNYAKNHPEYKSVFVLHSDGRIVGNESAENVSQYYFFSQCKKENAAIVSRPGLATTDGKMVIYVTVPIQNASGQFVGAISGQIDAVFLSELVSNVDVGENSRAYIIDGTGTVIGSDNYQDVLDQKNATNNASANKEDAILSSHEQRAINGESCFERIRYDGQTKLTALVPIPNTDHWAVGVMVNEWEFMDGTRKSALITIVLIIVVLIVMIVSLLKIVSAIIKPVIACVERLKRIADGDLSGDPLEIIEDNEIGAVAEATNHIQNQLQQIIADISYVLEGIASNDLTVEPQSVYRGDLVPIQQSLEKILGFLNGVVGNLNRSSSEVLAGAHQVADAAQSLTQGVIVQVEALEKLDDTMRDITEQVNDNAQHAVAASENSTAAAALVEQGNQQMAEMVQAMKKINATSDQIASIIKTIEDIAFQTNILALNAAVEAARAGQAGKGFSVVAEEVRNLAASSSTAARDTADLIEHSVAAVKEGAAIASATENTLREIVSSTQNSQQVIGKIAENSDQQTVSIQAVASEVMDISSVTQNNSATAQESAAAAQQLSAQAQDLQNLVEQFKLRS